MSAGHFFGEGLVGFEPADLLAQIKRPAAQRIQLHPEFFLVVLEIKVGEDALVAPNEAVKENGVTSEDECQYQSPHSISIAVVRFSIRPGRLPARAT